MAANPATGEAPRGGTRAAIATQRDAAARASAALHGCTLLAYACAVSVVLTRAVTPAVPTGNAPPTDFFRDQVYQSAEASGKPVPWDVKQAQPALATVSSCFKGKVLDCGCGTGDNSLWLAQQPGVTSVTGVDFASGAIKLAKERLSAMEKKPAAPVTFLQEDVFALPASLTDFDVLLDSAVFHCIGDDAAQVRYLASVTPRCKMGATAVMLVFSDKNLDPYVGPRRIPEAHARALWTEAGWEVQSLSHDHFYVDVMGRNEGKGAHAILMVARRIR